MERRRIGEKEVTLITLPSFASSGIAVMVSLRMLGEVPMESPETQRRKVSLGEEEDGIAMGGERESCR